MTDYHQLWKTLFLIKDYLIKNKIHKFKSFDLINNSKKNGKDSFKVPVKSSEEVIYYIKFYDLIEELTEKDIDNLYKEKGYNSFDEIYLVLYV